VITKPFAGSLDPVSPFAQLLISSTDVKEEYDNEIEIAMAVISNDEVR
jgi:hypothetical protein